ncbi:hypothetical protein GA0070616_4572 [Micromonospora nigra]|uniref:Uncharacterized protein n=1 Tax=Micromonospora nigra TaxID=145857 RepID=A0A1C6STD1_9ACTN|nr:hypothetical protein [Micromonospora nigra]SCL32856.1 hypothetical protein GA0070616_4572 [Micromonospora nigra]
MTTIIRDQAGFTFVAIAGDLTITHAERGGMVTVRGGVSPQDEQTCDVLDSAHRVVARVVYCAPWAGMRAAWHLFSLTGEFEGVAYGPELAERLFPLA